MIAKTWHCFRNGQQLLYPDDPIKREDMAVILAKTFKIIGKPLPNHSDSVLDKYSDKILFPYMLCRAWPY